MGYFRLLLAAFVAFSHFKGSYLPLNLGTSAVVCFYFISGYLMTFSFNRFKAHSTSPVLQFYVDRVFRIYPTYLLVLLSTFFLSLYMPLNVAALSLNDFLIVPLNFSTVFYDITSMVPNAWSLGAEIQFYILLPLLFTMTRKAKYLIFAILLFGNILSMTYQSTLGMIFTSVYPQCATSPHAMCGRSFSEVLPYFWLPFSFVFFMLGHLFYLAKEDKTALFLYRLFVACYALAYFLILSNGYLQRPKVTEICIGAFVLIPFAAASLRNIGTARQGMLDEIAGKLAYPLFLCHFLAQWLMNRYVIPGTYSMLYFGMLSLVLSFLIMGFQSTVDKYRYRLRGFSRVTQGERSGNPQGQPAMAANPAI